MSAPFSMRHSTTIVGPRSLGPLSTLNNSAILQDMHMRPSPLDYAS